LGRRSIHDELVVFLIGTEALIEPTIHIRAPQNTQEMSLAVDLQQQVWGYTEIDLVPDQIFIVAKESGGQVLFAFDQAKPVGFALAFAAIHDGTIYLHSHMVGVLPDYQNRGVGRLLKLAQREFAIARGINLIEWTFDPLQVRNAHFNLARLGAVVRRYLPNFYGRTSSPLHAGLPTDRLVAEWWIQSASVSDILSGKRRVPASDGVRVSLPPTIGQILSTDAQEAEKIQTRLRTEFEQHFAEGLAAVGFEFDEKQSSYLLVPYESGVL
jgi:predicted GNAT superfamily acetyltransferase